MAKYVKLKKVWKMLHSIGGCGAEPESWADGWDKAIDTAIKELDKLPAADVQELKHGSWSKEMLSKQDTVFGDFHFGFQCSVCGALMNKTAYCGNCGAKMDGKEVVKKDYNPCNKCTHKGWNMPQCQYCNKANGYKYMELDIKKFMESKNVPDRKDGE